jgi:hypothetical protein
MKLDARIIFIAGALTLGACSGGNFATGTGLPQTNPVPPVGGSPYPGTGPNGMPQSLYSGSPQGTPPPAGTYPITSAQTGFACPNTTTNYACVLKFNLPQPTPTPKPGKKGSPSPSPTPTPTPTPTADPTDDSGDGPTPSPSPTPASVTMNAEATPKDAPAMVHTGPNPINVVPLMMITLATNGDFPINGWAQAQYTLPKGQLENRGFALQLFQEATSHRRTTYTPLWTFDKSFLDDTTLTFNIHPPQMTIAKNSTYLLVLYADDKPNPTASPSPSPSPSSSPQTSASPAASASPSPVPSPT